MSFSFIISAGERRSDFVSRPQPIDYLFRFLLSPKTHILCRELEPSPLKEVGSAGLSNYMKADTCASSLGLLVALNHCDDNVGRSRNGNKLIITTTTTKLL